MLDRRDRDDDVQARRTDRRAPTTAVRPGAVGPAPDGRERLLRRPDRRYVDVCDVDVCDVAALRGHVDCLTAARRDTG